MKKQILIIFTIIGLCSFQLHAQIDGTFNNVAGTGDGLWATDTNWDSSTIADASGEATIDANFVW